MLSTPSSSAPPWSTSPSTPSALTSTLLNSIRAALCESTIAVRSVSMPLLLGSTRNSVSPSRSPAAPAVRAATINRSAVWPSTTKALAPLSLKPLPARTAAILVCSGRCLAPSSRASAASSEPSDIFGRYSDFCAALPPRDKAEAASTAVPRNGDGIKVRPISSITTPASTQPRPPPPKSSGTSRPENPISAKARHRSRENPVASFASRSRRRCDTGALSLMSPRALSRSIDCSSLRTSAIAAVPVQMWFGVVFGCHSGAARSVEPGISRFRVRVFDAPRNDVSLSPAASRPRQIENPFGHDAEHHLGSAALDRVGLGAQPGARACAAFRALALPFQRVDAARRHQDLVTALVQLGAVIFHRRGKCRMRLTGLGQIDRALGGAGQRRLVDLEAGDLSAQHRIFQTALLVDTNRIGGDLAERPADAALAHARNHRAFVLKQILRDIPATIDGADHVGFG